MNDILIKQADEEISIDNECNLNEDDIEWNNIKSVDEEETTNLFSQPELDSTESLSVLAPTPTHPQGRGGDRRQKI